MSKSAVVTLAALLTGCSAFPTSQTEFSVRNPLIHGNMKSKDGSDTTYLAEKAQAFVDAYKGARDNEGIVTIKKYIGTGITYSQLLCKDYFDKLTLTKAHRDFAKSQINLTAGLASALMGLAEASSASVAATGALFSFSEASFDSYNEAYIVSPELSGLERLVKEKQKEEEVIIYKKVNATSGAWPDRLETLDQAERVLGDYIFHCTVNGMKILLNASIQKKTEEIEKNTPFIQQNTGKLAPSALPQK
ncbi:hypothetical protein ACE1OG_03710 [Aeromonas hydrophila]